VSLNRSTYDAAKQEAERRGVSLTGLVEAGLAAIGVSVTDHPQQTVEAAKRSVTTRKARMTVTRTTSRPSHERQVLGDEIADAHGFQ
jgi:hypothetical protein